VKLSSAVKDIVVNRYPADQRAGLMAAVYVMEPTYPYKDVRGNLCDDVHSAAISVLSYQEDYTMALANPNDTLFLYLDSHSKADVDRLRSYFSKESKMDRRIAILKLVYEIDPDIPFLNRFPSSTVAEIIHSFGYEECTEDEWMSLTDGRFLSWMYSHEDHMACEALRIMTTCKQPSRSLGYKVLYNIDRNAAYDLREADTPFKVGEVLNEQLKTWQDLSDEEFDKQVADYTDPEGRFYYFAHLHGWIEQISQARACFDLKSEENRERLGAYDARTAAYRFCRILGVTPSYLLEDGNELKSGAGVDLAAYRPQMLTAIKQGSLSQWLSVFYHEDPTQDFTEEYSYERKLEEWVIKLGEIDKNHKYYKRFGKAKEETARKYGEVRKGYYKAKAKEKRWRIVYYGLCALFMLALIIFGIEDRDYLLRNSFTTIALPVGGMTAVIVGLRSYFRGYGFVMCCLWGVLGFLTSYIPITILKSVNSAYPSLFIPVIVVITLIYMLICHLTDYRTDSKGDNQLINEVMQDDIKSTLIEPLYYTFKQKSFRFKG
jgi:TRAP-type C4-dicarboxylate transport system permease small subunit